MGINFEREACTFMHEEDFKYFIRIVEAGSITKAAESLYISQPSLTKYLKKLEKRLGIELFDRTHQPLKLTLAGQYFYDYVINIQKEKHNLEQYISEIREHGRSTITIGMSLWRSSIMLPDFLPGFLERHPLTTVRLIEGSAKKLEEAIMNEDVDLCIMNLPVNYSNVTHIPLIEEYIYLVAGKNAIEVNAYYQTNSDINGSSLPWVDIRALKDKPFVMTQPGQHITEYVNSMLSKLNLNLPCIIRTANVTTAINLAASGLGFTFVPEFCTRSSYFPRNKVSLFLVDSPPLRCTLAVVYKKNNHLSQGAKNFIADLTRFIQANQS